MTRASSTTYNLSETDYVQSQVA